MGIMNNGSSYYRSREKERCPAFIALRAQTMEGVREEDSQKSNPSTVDRQPFLILQKSLSA